MPEKIENAPRLIMGLELYYIAFQDLMSSREVGMGLGPITWKTVQDYCTIKGLDEDQTEQMHYHIKKMDLFYMQHMRKK